MVDVYHVWWDPEVYREIARAGERIFAFHVSDWIVPLPDPLMGRGLMGEGVIEIRRLRQAVEAGRVSRTDRGGNFQRTAVGAARRRDRKRSG